MPSAKVKTAMHWRALTLNRKSPAMPGFRQEMLEHKLSYCAFNTVASLTWTAAPRLKKKLAV